VTNARLAKARATQQAIDHAMAQGREQVRNLEQQLKEMDEERRQHQAEWLWERERAQEREREREQEKEETQVSDPFADICAPSDRSSSPLISDFEPNSRRCAPLNEACGDRDIGG
jgi:hypothetical protein